MSDLDDTNTVIGKVMELYDLLLEKPEFANNIVPDDTLVYVVLGINQESKVGAVAILTERTAGDPSNGMSGPDLVEYPRGE